MTSLLVLVLCVVVTSVVADDDAQTYGFFCARKGERCGNGGAQQACCLPSHNRQPLYCSALSGICREHGEGGQFCAKEGESCRVKECCHGLFGHSLRCGRRNRCVRHGGHTCAREGESCRFRDCCSGWQWGEGLRCTRHAKRCVSRWGGRGRRHVRYHHGHHGHHHRHHHRVHVNSVHRHHHHHRGHHYGRSYDQQDD